MQRMYSAIVRVKFWNIMWPPSTYSHGLQIIQKMEQNTSVVDRLDRWAEFAMVRCMVCFYNIRTGCSASDRIIIFQVRATILILICTSMVALVLVWNGNRVALLSACCWNAQYRTLT